MAISRGLICLERLWDDVLAGGLVLIDDYYTWDGCAKAVHDFLAKRQAPEQIHQGPVGGTAYILKKSRNPAA
jgi:O-methyltransferase